MDRTRINQALQDIAGRPKHVRFEEIQNLLDNHIGPMFPNYNHHGNPHHAFTLGNRTFTIPEPKGTPFVRRVYVKEFLAAMQAVGLYEPEVQL